MEKVIEVRNVSLTYHSMQCETLALNNINFDVKSGEFVSIIGPSGCGKTTILSIISGLLAPSDGTVLVNGEPPKAKDSKCGYMFQRDNLLPWRNIEKNVLLGLEVQGKNTKENKERALNLLDKYGLKDFKRKRPDELSGGMRQRVALIRTLALNPSILLLDEPFSALDYQTRLNVCDDVANIIKQEKKTAILVTHDLQEAISMSDRILVLSKRPAHIKAIYTLDFDKSLTPLQKRQLPEAETLFNKLWGEIQDEEK
ncbi:MAG: ABC transporter ATP-binding protein [Clostridia bacterium]|nr:ABC transporter ATP-binding protein [Clostridia bacterium]